MDENKISKDRSSNELAQSRTEWAEDRTVLANERTFAGWMRTGMACIGVALGLTAVFNDTSYPYVAKAVAEIFIVAGVMIFWAAVSKARQTKERMDENDINAVSVQRMVILASILTVAAIFTGIVLWFL